MNNYLLRIKDWLIISFTMLFVFSVVWTIYAARNNVSKVSSQDLLTSTAWNNMIDNVDYLKWWLVIPTWLVSAFYTTSCPIWWKAADGSNWTPDLRWKFIRGLNNFNWTNWILTWDDSDKDWSSRILWSYQSDTIRNIIGTTGIYATSGSFASLYDWVFQPSTTLKTNVSNTKSTLVSWSNFQIEFNASNVVPTGSDNRPKNVALIYCIKE